MRVAVKRYTPLEALGSNWHFVPSDDQPDCRAIAGMIGADSPIEVCINPTQSTVMGYKVNGGVQYRFGTMDRDPQIPAAIFEFKPPAGTRNLGTIAWLTKGTPIPQFATPGTQPVTTAPPDLLSPPCGLAKSPATATTVYLEVGQDGLPHNARAMSAPSAELEACVNNLRFQPGMLEPGVQAYAAVIVFPGQ